MAGGQETDTRKAASSSASNVADGGKKPDDLFSVDDFLPLEESSDVKKLTLWNVQTVSPIMSHRQLQQILATHGFVRGEILAPEPQHGDVKWLTYTYVAGSGWRAKLKNQAEEPPVVLPYPEIDGHHEMTYQAFLEALDFYLDLGVGISNILQVRSTEMASRDKGRQWTIQNSGEGKQPYKYTPETLDVAALTLILKNQLNNNQDQNLGNDDDDDDDIDDDDDDDDIDDDDEDYAYADIDDDDEDAVTRWKTRRTSGSSPGDNVPLKDIITTLPKNE